VTKFHLDLECVAPIIPRHPLPIHLPIKLLRGEFLCVLVKNAVACLPFHLAIEHSWRVRVVLLELNRLFPRKGLDLAFLAALGISSSLEVWRSDHLHSVPAPRVLLDLEP